MKKIAVLLLIPLFLLSCKPLQDSNNKSFKSIIIDTIFKDKISIRAITISNNKVYFAADKSRIGYIDLQSNRTSLSDEFINDSIKYEFRSIATNSKAVFSVNVGNPARLFKFSKNLASRELVYEERNEKVFYDSMQFWNDSEGIAIGDPTENCFSVLITRNKGNTWSKIDCIQLPKIEDGEAAFAASNTNIVCKGNATWIVSGGKKARIFYSPDKGISWTVFDTPIVQGETMTGIFTSDFYNEKIGFIAGGNYDKPNQNSQNKAITLDGGKSWQLVSENQGFGYASCIQFVPDGKGKELVCVGANGLYYSSDSGSSWKQFSTDKSLYTIRFINRTTAIAAGKDKIIKISFL